MCFKDLPFNFVKCTHQKAVSLAFCLILPAEMAFMCKLNCLRGTARLMLRNGIFVYDFNSRQQFAFFLPMLHKVRNVYVHRNIPKTGYFPILYVLH